VLFYKYTQYALTAKLRSEYTSYTRIPAYTLHYTTVSNAVLLDKFFSGRAFMYGYSEIGKKLHGKKRQGEKY